MSTLIKSQHRLLVQQFERDLPQIILKSETPEHALVVLLERLVDVLKADSCVLGILNREQMLIRSLDCHPQSAPSFSQTLSPWFSLLALPTIQAQLAETELIAIADFHSLPKSQPESQNRSQATGRDAFNQSSAPSLIAPEAGSATVATALGRQFSQTDLPQARAILIAKTQFQGRHNGILLLTRSQPHVWKEPDIQLVKMLADQVAIAICQMQLEQQVQQQVRYQTVLDQLASAVRHDCQQEQIFPTSG